MDSFVRFFGLFGFFCSGFWNCWGKISCSGCSVDFVEKMWESLWGSRWENGGKYCVKVRRGGILGDFCGIDKFFAGVVEKFYGWICTWYDLFKRAVLHSFHRVYYYDY